MSIQNKLALLKSADSLGEANCLKCCWEGSFHTSALRRPQFTLCQSSHAMTLPISQQAEHCGWHSLSQHGRMIGPHCSLPSLPLIMASAEQSQRMQTSDHHGGVSAPWEYDRVGDLSSAPLMRLKLWRHLKGRPPHLNSWCLQEHSSSLTPYLRLISIWGA